MILFYEYFHFIQQLIQILRSLAYIHFSGLILWQTENNNEQIQKQTEQDYNKIVDYALIENRIQQPVKYNNNNYFFQVVKDLQLIIICCVPMAIKLVNVEELLSGLLIAFIKKYEASIRSCTIDYDSEQFKDFNKVYEQSLINLVKTGQINSQKQIKEIDSSVNQTTQQNQQPIQQQQQTTQSSEQPQQQDQNEKQQEQPQIQQQLETPEERINRLKEQMKQKQLKEKQQKFDQINKKKLELQKQKEASLTLSKVKQSKKEESEEVLVYDDSKSQKSEEIDLFQSNAKSLKELLQSDKPQEQQSVFNIFKGKEISQEEFNQFSTQMQNRLTGQNVSQEVAENILRQVQVSFDENQSQRTRKGVQQILKAQISKILKSDSSNLIECIQKHVEAKRSGNTARPYTICVVGINGMGKTTTIGKLTYMLKQLKMTPFLVAADSFRSGAIEQLQTHAQKLQVGFYDQGYGKVPSSIAKYGVIESIKQDADVCLIDTAGRMQNNQKLMQELVTLIQDNKPDKILFVGEALIGSTGVEQLKEFNQKIQQECGRGIDGIILTKYDAVGNKVGSALNYCYISGLPIYFVGVGQAYPDLVPLDIEDVVDSLIN